MVKVLTIITCSTCNGKAYLLTTEIIYIGGLKYFRHKPCSTCQGRGKLIKWLNLTDLASLLDEINKDRHSRKGLL